jgi:hypothetical protein
MDGVALATGFWIAAMKYPGLKALKPLRFFRGLKRLLKKSQF